MYVSDCGRSSTSTDSGSTHYFEVAATHSRDEEEAEGKCVEGVG